MFCLVLSIPKCSCVRKVGKRDRNWSDNSKYEVETRNLDSRCSEYSQQYSELCVTFEVFTAVTMKNAIF
jgi:hypothetical protein